MLEKLNKLLTIDELLFLNSICNEFIENVSYSIKTKHNYYIRKILDPTTDLLEYQKNCKIHIGSEYELDGVWINKINATTNYNDNFHNDETALTIITYLNENFEGGEFEYISKKEKIKIKPITNCSLIINNKIQHRVLNVTKGERFSLVSFYTKPYKKIKTLI